MRVDGAVVRKDYAADATAEHGSGALLVRRSEFDSPLIDIGIKYFADGTPLSKTALLVEPYADDPSTRGEMTSVRDSSNASNRHTVMASR